VEALTLRAACVPLASRAQEMARRVRPLKRKKELNFEWNRVIFCTSKRLCADFWVLFYLCEIYK
jgi:hypothetical protein